MGFMRAYIYTIYYIETTTSWKECDFECARNSVWAEVRILMMILSLWNSAESERRKQAFTCVCVVRDSFDIQPRESPNLSFHSFSTGNSFPLGRTWQDTKGLLCSGIHEATCFLIFLTVYFCEDYFAVFYTLLSIETLKYCAFAGYKLTRRGCEANSIWPLWEYKSLSESVCERVNSGRSWMYERELGEGVRLSKVEP